MYRFAHTGLTQDEQSMLKRWMLSSATLGYSHCLPCFTFSFRNCMMWEIHHSDMGLTAQYDAVSCFVLPYRSSGASHHVHPCICNNNIWSTWTHYREQSGLVANSFAGIGGLVLFLSSRTMERSQHHLLSLMIVYLEFSIRKSIRVSNEIYNPSAIFDHEGRRRYVTYVDCSCQGVAYPIDTSPEHTGLLRYESLCDNIGERHHLISMVSKHQLTDVIIGGCDASPLPESFQDTVSSARCTLRGLDLLGLQGSLPNDNIQLRKEVNIHLENVVDPWSSKQRLDACMRHVEPEERTNLRFVDAKQWPELKQGTLRVSGKSWSDDERMQFEHNTDTEPNN